MAWFGVHFHYTPADYYALTVEQRDALVRAMNKANRRRR